MAHRRRGVGVGRSAGAKLVQKKADEIKALSLQSAMDTVEKLEIRLTEFAKRHQHEIQSDPAIRQKFLQMCAPLGVDPLRQQAHHHKSHSIWSFLEMGDLYYSLAVQVAEVCWATRSRNGGIISVAEVQTMLGQRTTKFNMAQSTASATTSSKKNNKSKNRYSVEDIQVAITKLSKLGNGFRIVTVGSTPMIVSVPTELDQDHTQVMTLAQDSKGCVTVEQVMQSNQWKRDRAERALNLLLGEGMAWLDQHRGETYFWFPSIWKESQLEQEEDEPA